MNFTQNCVTNELAYLQKTARRIKGNWERLPLTGRNDTFELNLFTPKPQPPHPIKLNVFLNSPQPPLFLTQQTTDISSPLITLV